MKLLALLLLALPLTGCIGNHVLSPLANIEHQQQTPIAHAGKIWWNSPGSQHVTQDSLTIYGPGLGMLVVLRDEPLPTSWDSVTTTAEHSVCFHAFYGSDTLVFRGESTPGTIYTYVGRVELRGARGVSHGGWRVST